jgi:hypothetical protein
MVTIDMPLGADSVAVDGTKPRPNDVTEGRYTGLLLGSLGSPSSPISWVPFGFRYTPWSAMVGHDILHPIFIS